MTYKPYNIPFPNWPLILYPGIYFHDIALKNNHVTAKHIDGVRNLIWEKTIRADDITCLPIEPLVCDRINETAILFSVSRSSEDSKSDSDDETEVKRQEMLKNAELVV